jgi:hypothetical protein
MTGFAVVAQEDKLTDADELSHEKNDTAPLLQADSTQADLAAPGAMEAGLDRQSLDWTVAVGGLVENEDEQLQQTPSDTDDAGATATRGPSVTVEHKWKKFATAVATVGVLGTVFVAALASSAADTTVDTTAASVLASAPGVDCVGYWTFPDCTNQCFEHETYTYSEHASETGAQCEFPEGLTRPHVCTYDCRGHWVGDCNNPDVTVQEWVVDEGCGCVPPYCADDLTLGKVLLPDGRAPTTAECEELRHTRWVMPECGTNCFSEFEFDESLCATEGGEPVSRPGGTTCMLEVAAPAYDLAAECVEGEICPHVPFTPTRVRECPKDCQGYWETDACDANHCMQVYKISQQAAYGGEPCEYPPGATRLELVRQG